ncbi:MAG TPA: TIGR00725 family protein [Micromonosporaceae bacterium]|nr:TIGR00725 family protein [Micromonosporaceae bacterium]
MRQVAVCGPAECTEAESAVAYDVGVLLARGGAVVLCGGGGGVMAAVAAGVRSADGLVIGIRPDGDRATAAPDLSAIVLTNMGQARNAILVASADAVITIGGSWGTLSEVALARRRGVPVIALHGWLVLDQDGRPVPGIEVADTAAAAVKLAVRPA